MKQLLLIICVLCTFQSFASDTTKHHAIYASACANWSPNLSPSYTLEAGTWGLSSNTSFGATLDGIYTNKKLTTFVGLKAYYTVHSEDKLCYMVYVAVKESLDGNDQQLIEFGFNPYYTLNKNLLLGVTLGNQTFKESQLNLFMSVGFVYLFKK